LISQERIDEKRVQRQLIAKSIHIMLALNFYNGSFEEEFLHDTAQFYKQDSQAKADSLTLPDYAKYVE